ncbi:Protein tyrosine phosphatase type IVA 1 [Gryganskiella cystojenkinii]|nr:Protein tyrosine phosphatase type IVA 1 [Gryganskiella cystojenkinii]
MATTTTTTTTRSTPGPSTLSRTGTHSEPRLLNRPAVIEYQNMRFLVSDAPSDSNLVLYTAEFERHHAKEVVRVCDPTYGTAPLTRLGISVHDWPFGDGEGPPANIVNEWLALVKQRFGIDPANKPSEAIVVHCVAGLGRAPLLVAIALMEIGGLSNEESIQRVRDVKRGALNMRQHRWLIDYKPRGSRKGKKCLIM